MNFFISLWIEHALGSTVGALLGTCWEGPTHLDSDWGNMLISLVFGNNMLHLLVAVPSCLSHFLCSKPGRKHEQQKCICLKYE